LSLYNFEKPVGHTQEKTRLVRRRRLVPYWTV